MLIDFEFYVNIYKISGEHIVGSTLLVGQETGSGYIKFEINDE